MKAEEMAYWTSEKMEAQCYDGSPFPRKDGRLRRLARRFRGRLRRI